MGRRGRIIYSPEAKRDLNRLKSVRRSEWKHMLMVLGEHPRIGVKVGTEEGQDVRRYVLDKSKVLVYYIYAELDDELTIMRVHHGSAEHRPFEN